MRRRRLAFSAFAIFFALACSSESEGTGASAGSGGGAGAGAGGATSCATIDDCPPASACATYSCVAGKCVGTLQADGAIVPGKVISGDCKQVVCDGSGNITEREDDMDVPNDGNPCTDDVCQGGKPSNPTAHEGQSCGTGAMMRCQSGVCIGCNNAEQCPQGNVCQKAGCMKVGGQDGICQLSINVGAEVSDADPTDCIHAVCDELGNIVATAIANGSTCGSSTFCAPAACASGTCVAQPFTDAGTPTPTQTPGDCSITKCDGMGNEETDADSTDVPPSPNACQYYQCSGTMPVLENRPAGTSCPGGVSGCDGMGNCV